jgi:hypothetical protein
MTPLERLFGLEVEFQRMLRSVALGTADATALHTSYALQAGYEALLRQTDRVTTQDIGKLAERFTLAEDARDVLAARDSLTRLLDLPSYKA